MRHTTTLVEPVLRCGMVCCMASPPRFYDGLAPDYHALFEDWWASAERQGRAIAALLQERGLRPPATILDCACGIGTQSLPLAAAGYNVIATDVSHAAVKRARIEAKRRRLTTRFAVVDMKSVGRAVVPSVDAALACDNALSHLMTATDLDAALSSVRLCLSPGAIFIASQRDYDKLLLTRPEGTPVEVYGPPGKRFGTRQSWAWSSDGLTLDIALFVLRERGATRWDLAMHETQHRVLRRSLLTDALYANGFTSVEWLDSARSGLEQPFVVAVAE